MSKGARLQWLFLRLAGHKLLNSRHLQVSGRLILCFVLVRVDQGLWVGTCQFSSGMWLENFFSFIYILREALPYILTFTLCFALLKISYLLYLNCVSFCVLFFDFGDFLLLSCFTNPEAELRRVLRGSNLTFEIFFNCSGKLGISSFLSWGC